MKLGKEKIEILKSYFTGILLPGMEMIVTNAIALPATAAAVREHREELGKWFSDHFLMDAEKLEILHTSMEQLEVIKELQAESYCEMGSGGVYASMWIMAEASNAGLEIQLRKIPVRQETIEVFERLDLNPYQMNSGASFLIGTFHGAELLHGLQEKGIPAVSVGFVRKGPAKLLHNDGNIRYLDRPDLKQLEGER